MLFLTCSTILEPDLCHSLTQPSHTRNSLQILSIGIRVNVEVCLKNLKLFLRESRSNAFRFIFIETLTIVSICID